MSWLKGLYLQLISPQANGGPSATKWVYLHAGALSTYCATLATVGGVAVYVTWRTADAIYWTAVGALWVNALGFATSAKKHAATATKEVTLAQASSTPAPQTPAAGPGGEA